MLVGTLVIVTCLRRAPAVRPAGRVVDRARRQRSGRSRSRRWRACRAFSSRAAPCAAAARRVLALTLVAVLAIPLSADVSAIRDRVSDAGYVGALPGEEQQPLSAYLLAHQDGARDEVAAESATGIGSLIVQDARPIVVLTSYGARVFTTRRQAKLLIADGDVRYAFLNSNCGHHASADERRLLRTGALDPRAWNRRLATGGSQPRQGAVAAAGSAAMSVEQPATLEALALRRASGGKDRARHRVHGRGPLPDAAVPRPARDPRRRRTARSGSRSSTRWRRISTARRSRRCSRTRTIQVVVHAGRQDIALVRRRFAARRSATCSTLRSRPASPGWRRRPPTTRCWRRLLGVRVAKSASFTRWDARPLSPEQLAYAREDVVHLLELAAELERRLAELGRLQWAHEECEPLERSSDERDPESDLRAPAPRRAA